MVADPTLWQVHCLRICPRRMMTTPSRTVTMDLLISMMTMIGMAVHNMWQEGDGEQDVRFFLRKVEDVVRELVADELLEGCQHFAFKEYKNTNGDRILGGHANGSVSFQIDMM